MKWKTFETRSFHAKATLMYKILNDLSCSQLGEYRPLVFFVRTSLCSVRTVKTSGRYSSRTALALG